MSYFSRRRKKDRETQGAQGVFFALPDRNPVFLSILHKYLFSNRGHLCLQKGRAICYHTHCPQGSGCAENCGPRGISGEFPLIGAPKV